MAPKYILGKTDSLANDSVKTEHLHVKDWNRSLPLTQDLFKKKKKKRKIKSIQNGPTTQL